jgi:hypothetical protein
VQWRTLILEDPEALVVTASSVLGVPLPSAPFIHECRRQLDRSEASGPRRLGGSDWEDGSWWSWLKNRAMAIEIPAYRGTAVESDIPFEWLFDEGDPVRSRIGTTEHFLQPINCVAAAVLPIPNST